MKKYVKPELFYEQFELSTHIANCMFEYISGNKPEECKFITDETYGVAGQEVFTTIQVCGIEFDGPTCYYPGTDGTNTFAS